MEITPTALVIGGGVSGMTAALNIANQEFKTYIIEKEERLGGNLLNLSKLYPTQEDSSFFLKELIERVLKNNNIQIFLNSKIKEVNGYLGNYNISIIDSKKEINDLEIGTIVVATGAKELKPQGLYGYGVKNNDIITQLELPDLSLGKLVSLNPVSQFINFMEVHMQIYITILSKPQ